MLDKIQTTYVIGSGQASVTLYKEVQFKNIATEAVLRVSEETKHRAAIRSSEV